MLVTEPTLEYLLKCRPQFTFDGAHPRVLCETAEPSPLVCKVNSNVLSEGHYQDGSFISRLGGMMLDLAIRNGLVIDGTGSPGQLGDVGVRDGRIVAVGEIPNEALEEVDATGLVVAPGFVDVHTHFDAQVF